MYKYLAFTYNDSGQWMQSSPMESYVFEAVDDREALQVMTRYLLDTPHIKLKYLGRIIVSLRTEEIELPDDLPSDTLKPLTPEEKANMGFSSLTHGVSLMTQLQTFDPSAREERLQRIERKHIEKTAQEMLVASMKTPEPGDVIYVPPRLFVTRGREDTSGGRATVTRVSKGMSAGEEVHFVSFKEINGSFNWEHHLAPAQDDLRRRFGDGHAHPDPDHRPEFNED